MTTPQDPPKTRQASRQPGGALLGSLLIAVGVILLLERLGLRLPWRELLSALLILIGAGVVATARRGVPSWLVTAGVVTGIALLLVSAGGLSLARGFGPADERSTTLEFTEPVRALDVDLDAGTLDVVGGADAVRGERSVRFRSREPRITEEIVDGVLRIRVDCAGLFSFGCRATYRLEVPSNVDVEVSSGSGSLRLMDVAGSVRADTGSGRIDLHRIGGEVEAETGSGRITGAELASGRFVGDTGSGAIDLQFSSPPDLLEIETGSGGVNVRVPQERYAVELDTGSGTTAITDIIEDAGAPRRIEIETGSGGITVAGVPTPR
jgi:hypothetical protein